MGGLMVIFSVLVSTILWVDITNPYSWLVLWTFLGFAAIGFADDYAKLTKSSHKGVPGKLRLLLEGGIALVAVLAEMNLTSGPLGSSLAFPFFKNLLLDMGWFFAPFGVLVIVGAANAVNLTDGLDGLAIGPIMIAGLSFGLISYLVGNAHFANYLQIHFVPEAGELAVFCGALVGAGAWIFVVQRGRLRKCSWAIRDLCRWGGALGAMAVVTKHEIVLAIIAGCS